MAISFDSVSIKGLRKAHFEQLREYFNIVEDNNWACCGISSGCSKKSCKRHQELKDWLEDIIEFASREGVVIPKK